MAWARSLLSVVELSGGHFPKKCLEVIDNERLEGGARIQTQSGTLY